MEQRDRPGGAGARGIVVWVCPSLDLVVAQGPGPFYRDTLDENLLPAVVDAVRD